MNNITLTNVTAVNSLLPPGIIRCNETNPCTGFVWDNVQASGWWKFFKLGFITEHVSGTVTNSSPVPAFDGQGSNFDLGRFIFEEVKALLNGLLCEAFSSCDATSKRNEYVSITSEFVEKILKELY